MKLVRTVSGLLWHLTKENKIEVLLHKHKYLNMFIGFGGKVKTDEMEASALEREIFEESGIALGLCLGNVGDYQRWRYKAPDDVVTINLENGYETYVDHTYFIQVDEEIRQQEIQAEEGVTEYGWYEIDWAIENLPMFDDTKEQLNRISRPIFAKKISNKTTEKHDCHDQDCFLCKEVERLKIYQC